MGGSVVSVKNYLQMQIRIEDLSKTYPNGKKALNGINLEIENGMFGLLGPNEIGRAHV